MNDPIKADVTCPFCHARVSEADYIAHDIGAHGGLARQRDAHRTVCVPFYRNCICRLADYERVAAQRGVSG